MEKVMYVLVALLLISGCGSQETKDQDFEKHARVCNKICYENKEISEVQFKAGGGVPLLFLGGVEAKCACQLRK